MSGTHASPPDGAWYEIRVQGRLDSRWSAWLDGLTVNQEERTTLIRGPFLDQSALHGLLAQLRDLNVPLISVGQVDLAPDQQAGHPPHLDRRRHDPDTTAGGRRPRPT